MTYYDVIGDIHGQAGKLKALLGQLGYDSGRGWRAPAGRQAVFIGDLIDRGPAQLEVIAIVRRMIDAGDARCVMGNHEFNAIGYATPRVGEAGSFLRRHSEKNVAQHAEFLRQVGADSPLHRELIAWFKTLPPALDLGPIRVVHAWWHQPYVDLVNDQFWHQGRLDDEFLQLAYQKHSAPWEAMEGLTKGLETPLPEGASFRDHDGFERFRVRTRWWLDPPQTYRQIAIVDDRDLAGIPALPLPEHALPAKDGGAPVFIGHYWMTGTPRLQAPTVACVDYSAARAGPLVAYCWRGERELNAAHFFAAA